MAEDVGQPSAPSEADALPAGLGPTPFARAFRKYMLFVAVAGNGIFYIQGWKIFANESAKDVSATAFSFSFWAVSSWFVYGIVTKDKVIILANIIAMIGAALVLFGCWYYS